MNGRRIQYNCEFYLKRDWPNCRKILNMHEPMINATGKRSECFVASTTIHSSDYCILTGIGKYGLHVAAELVDIKDAKRDS